MFLVACGLFAMFFFNTLYLQRVLGYSALEGGLAFLPFTFGIIIGAGLSQKLLPAIGAREVPLIGLTMAVAGMLLFLRLTPDGTYLVDFLPGLMLTSIGMGLTFVPVTLIATSGIPDGDAGLASGIFNTSQQVGGALGLAMLSTIATSRTTGVIEDLGREPGATDTASALVDGFQLAWIGSAVLLAAGAVLLLALLRRSDVAATSHGETAPVVA